MQLQNERALEWRVIKTHNTNLVVNHAKPTYDFIDLIRFISMLGIVLLHSTVLPQNLDLYTFAKQTDYPFIFISFLLVLRFSVICFFLISGFLLINNINNKEGSTYFKNRVAKLMKPYLFAFIVFSILRALSNHNSSSILLALKQNFLFTAFWFVPVSLLAMLIILILLRFNNYEKTGKVLFILLLPVIVQFVYIHPLAGTSPVFALIYVFYFWLGGYIKIKRLIPRIQKMKLWYISIIWVVSFILLLGETMFFYERNCTSILYNLRITNQIYGVTSFLFLIKLSPYFNKFSLFNPRTETFGIYLYHTVILGITSFIFSRIHYFDFNTTATASAIGYTLFKFVIVYALTTAFVKVAVSRRWLFLSSSN
jgi:fucose 4-O-acetylase-like acetyltransferase